LAVLRSISKGRSYDQVLQDGGCESYVEIFHAAAEALEVLECLDAPRLDRIRERHPRAYEPWTEEEEDSLKDAVHSGRSFQEIGEQLGRQQSAISSRVHKLKLKGVLS
jgi:DNA-binding NarL/FixJ family response regulator